MSCHFPDDAQLLELAGKAAFERGRGYHVAGRVALSLVSDSALAGEAYGTKPIGCGWQATETTGSGIATALPRRTVHSASIWWRQC
jgi:hypothetical protein